MSTPTKARVAALICALFVVWPGVHRAIVAIYDTNAWQLGGFAMYATPPARTAIIIVETRDGQQTIVSTSDQPAELLEQRQRFAIRRGVLGRMLPPDALAEAYFDALPEAEHIEVLIRREILSASTARIERNEVIHVYDRPIASESRAVDSDGR